MSSKFMSRMTLRWEEKPVNLRQERRGRLKVRKGWGEREINREREAERKRERKRKREREREREREGLYVRWFAYTYTQNLVKRTIQVSPLSPVASLLEGAVEKVGQQPNLHPLLQKTRPPCLPSLHQLPQRQQLLP
jgi:hypothetical protein